MEKQILLESSRISGFADEIAVDMDTQIALLKDCDTTLEHSDIKLEHCDPTFEQCDTTVSTVTKSWSTLTAICITMIPQ